MANKRTTRNEVETVFTGKDEISSVVGKISPKLVSFAKKFGPLALAIGAVVGGLLALRKGMQATIGVIQTSLRTVPEQAVKLQGLADALGISTEAAQGFGFAAAKAGIQSDALNLAVQRMTRRIGEAAKGGGEAKKEIAALGFDIDALVRMRPEEQFLKVADALEGVRGKSERLASAFKFFDSEGARPVLALMERFPGTLRDQIARAEELGGVMSRELIDKSLAYKASQVELQTAISGVREEIANQFLPVATDAAMLMANWLASNREAIAQTGESLAREFSRGLKTIQSFMDEYGDDFLEALRYWGEIAGSTAELVINVTSAAAKVAYFFLNRYGEQDEYSKWLEESNRAMEEGAGHAGNLEENITAGALAWIEQQARADEVAELTRQIAQAEADLVEAGEKRRVQIEDELETLRQYGAEAPPDLRFTIGIGREFGEMPEEDGWPAGLPRLEQIEEVSARFGDLNAAVEEFGTNAVMHTLRISATLDQIREQAKVIFIDEFAANVTYMGRTLSLTFVQNFRDMETFAQKARAVWRNFTDEVIAALIRLVAKMAIVAVLQAFLGFGNFGAVSRILQIIGMLKSPQFSEGWSDVQMMQRGGVVPGRLAGDRVSAMLEPGEGILSRRGLAALGRSNLAQLNEGNAPMGPQPGELGSRPLEVTFNVRTILGSREEGRALARAAYDYMAEMGLAPSVTGG